ncbi:hypothetical protein AB5N19_06587 [Seiridium cardinale]|uniref:Uncharacterized protein n=1 Tax=Seiridium cardinale TaxID=138064 RepID=A0ABR2XZF5_9PEZI
MAHEPENHDPISGGWSSNPDFWQLSLKSPAHMGLFVDLLEQLALPHTTSHPMSFIRYVGERAMVCIAEVHTEDAPELIPFNDFFQLTWAAVIEHYINKANENNDAHHEEAATFMALFAVESRDVLARPVSYGGSRFLYLVWEQSPWLQFVLRAYCFSTAQQEIQRVGAEPDEDLKDWEDWKRKWVFLHRLCQQVWRGGVVEDVSFLFGHLSLRDMWTGAKEWDPELIDVLTDWLGLAGADLLLACVSETLPIPTTGRTDGVSRAVNYTYPYDRDESSQTVSRWNTYRETNSARLTIAYWGHSQVRIQRLQGAKSAAFQEFERVYRLCDELSTKLKVLLLRTGLGWSDLRSIKFFDYVKQLTHIIPRTPLEIKRNASVLIRYIMASIIMDPEYDLSRESMAYLARFLSQMPTYSSFGRGKPPDLSSLAASLASALFVTTHDDGTVRKNIENLLKFSAAMELPNIPDEIMNMT